MDPTSRFISALALAASSLWPTGAKAADASTELEMYKRCKTGGSRWDCEAFLNAFPSSRYAPDVVGTDADRNRGGEKSGFNPHGHVIY